MWYNAFGVKEGFVSMPSRIAITVGSPAVIGSEMVDKTVDWLWSAIECGEIEVAFRAKLAFLEAEAIPADHTPGMPRAAGSLLEYTALVLAVRSALEASIDALCSAPRSMRVAKPCREALQRPRRISRRSDRSFSLADDAYKWRPSRQPCRDT